MKHIQGIVLSVALALMAAVTVVGVIRYKQLFTENAQMKLLLSTTEASLAAKTRALEQAREARAVLDAHMDRVARDAAHWRRVAADLSEKEGADEPLNPYERAVLDSLRDN